MSIPTIITDYIDYQQAAGKKPITCKNYQSDMMGFANWFTEKNNESVAIAKITPTDTRSYKRHLIAKGYKPQTINRRIISLNHFLKWAWEAKNVKHQFALLKPVKQMQLAPRWLNKHQQHLLLRLVEKRQKLRDITIIKCLLNTGLRLHELCALQWRDITIAARRGILVVRSGKGEKYREVPLNKDVRECLLQLGYTKYAGKEIALFRGQRGNLSKRGVQLMLQQLVKGTTLESVTPHQLRHTFCKNLIDADVGLEKVAALAGHESLDTTKRYCQPSLSDLSEAVERIGECE